MLAAGEQSQKHRCRQPPTPDVGTLAVRLARILHCKGSMGHIFHP